jgi:hypothetical protein
MDDDKRVTDKLAEAITKAVDTVKHTVEDIAEAAARAPQPVYPSSDGLILTTMPLFVPARRIKRAPPRHTTKKTVKTLAKKTNKKKSKKFVKKSAKQSSKKRKKRRL